MNSNIDQEICDFCEPIRSSIDYSQVDDAGCQIAMENPMTEIDFEGILHDANAVCRRWRGRYPFHRPTRRSSRAIRMHGSRHVGCNGRGASSDGCGTGADHRSVFNACGDSLTVTVGVSGQSGTQVADRVREAQSIGATAVMASLIIGKANDAAVYAYYSEINDASGIPIVVQDLPEQTGVHMSAEFIARLNADLDNAKYLKLEDPPTHPRSPPCGAHRMINGHIWRARRSVPV